MDTSIAKKGFQSAEKELREEQVNEVKKIVKKTLKELQDVEKQIKTLQDRKRFLKLDIDDLKEGRLDRIEERQKTDPKAKEASVVTISKLLDVRHDYSTWDWPYKVEWKIDNWVSYGNNIPSNMSFGNHVGLVTSELKTTDMVNVYSSTSVPHLPVINCSVAKDSTKGAYELNGDGIVHVR